MRTDAGSVSTSHLHRVEPERVAGPRRRNPAQPEPAGHRRDGSRSPNQTLSPLPRRPPAARGGSAPPRAAAFPVARPTGQFAWGQPHSGPRNSTASRHRSATHRPRSEHPPPSSTLAWISARLPISSTSAPPFSPVSGQGEPRAGRGLRKHGKGGRLPVQGGFYDAYALRIDARRAATIS